MVDFSAWRLFWPAALLALLAGHRSLRRRRAACLALGALAPLSVVWLAYVVNDRPALLVEATWNRFLLQGLVPWLALLSLALDDLLRRAPWLPGWISPQSYRQEDPQAGGTTRQIST
jgi:hypothetical protein